VDGRGELGQRGEAIAEAFLRALRYRVLARNFRCRAGEIDIVAQEGNQLVFVEVRSRRGQRQGTALESVTPRKQAQVVRVARHFLALRGLGDCDSRFDVIGVDFAVDPPDVAHVQHAFDAGG
jgi:putative endonuclease